MLINLALRAHNANFGMDPIVRSLTDQDFYKLLMCQTIWENYPNARVSFLVRNRTTKVRLADVIAAGRMKNGKPDLTEIQEQFDYVRTLRFRKSELINLAGNTFYGTRGIFKPEFLDWLSQVQLPDYELAATADGQLEIRFHGSWPEVTLWEIIALCILNELKTRTGYRKLSKFELDVLFSKATSLMWDKVQALKAYPELRVSDFGTRRRHSYLWQEKVVSTMAEELGDIFVGTSNASLAMKYDLEAIGTNAHELPMAMAAMAAAKRDQAALKQSQYDVLGMWSKTYGGALLIMLPDTFGTAQFLEDAPDWVADWTGLRVDSKDPVAAGEEYIAWLESRGRDPRSKRILFSDGLDLDEITRLHKHFHGRIIDGYGWGTKLTNDFRSCHPRGEHDFDPISLVCKVETVDGHPAVKLSDNYTKATGPAEEVAFYRQTFGTKGVSSAPVEV